MKTGTKKFASLFLLTTFSIATAGCGTQISNNATTNTSNATGGARASKTITIAWLPWTEDVATTHLWKVLLEQKGYTVNLKELDVGPLLLGLSKGGVDAFFDLWLPAEQNNIKKYKSNISYLTDWYTGESSEGVAVPKYMTNINTPQELNAHAAQFKHRIVGIDPGSQEENSVKKMVKVYGMNHIHVQDSSTPAMLTALKQAVKAKRPIAVVMWTPHWAFTKYNLKYISDPKYIVKSKTTNKILVAANKKWAKDNPTVSGWFSNFKLTPNQLASLEEYMKNTKDKDSAAKKWIAKNQSLISSWF
ncbi:glycine betaine ABC transporter substrate-binding protein [Alicyclobacillus sp. SO9]|uniref:glycine betaine ABC transporter substrate-binding protein n=1 Tax=Alicyclobacillus sp. SO9 TaxID=2665646 RepID=UPI0018E7D1FB|nr:glycine betaine ABC transporter substrate-binding protein [Alicyclobacillus sp. SO9]QQE77662.1 glycine betaine ABC transporter substrate-binding protein [Alicyclobacillus sp. SO9]